MSIKNTYRLWHMYTYAHKGIKIKLIFLLMKEATIYVTGTSFNNTLIRKGNIVAVVCWHLVLNSDLPALHFYKKHYDTTYKTK